MRGSVDGLVLREWQTGENDKLLSVLTAEYGKIRVCAKGARSVKSRIAPLCRPFTYANFEFYEKNKMRWLSGGSVTDSFFGLHSDIEGFALAAYVLEVADEITGEGVDGAEVLRTTLNTLYLIEKNKKPREIIKGAFELFCAAQSGLAPDLTSCRECGKEGSEGFCLDVMNGNLLCSSCLARQGGTGGAALAVVAEAAATRHVLLPLSPAVLMAMRYVLGATPARLFAFDLPEAEDLAFFSRAGEVYLLNHLERGFDTLQFYHSLKTSEFQEKGTKEDP